MMEIVRTRYGWSAGGDRISDVVGAGTPQRERRQGAIVSQCRRRDVKHDAGAVWRAPRTGYSWFASKGAEEQRAGRDRPRWDATRPPAGRASRRCTRQMMRTERA